MSDQPFYAPNRIVAVSSAPRGGASSRPHPARSLDADEGWFASDCPIPPLRQIPIIVMTTSNQDEDVGRSYDLGACSFSQSPSRSRLSSA